MADNEMDVYEAAIRSEMYALGEWAKERAYDYTTDPKVVISVLRDRLAALREDILKRKLAA